MFYTLLPSLPNSFLAMFFVVLLSMQSISQQVFMGLTNEEQEKWELILLRKT